MRILLYKPPSYDLDQCARDINFYPEEDMIKDAINSFFLERELSGFRWLETIRRDHARSDNYPPAYWMLSNPKVFKTLTVVPTE